MLCRHRPYLVRGAHYRKGEQRVFQGQQENRVDRHLATRTLVYTVTSNGKYAFNPREEVDTLGRRGNMFCLPQMERNERICWPWRVQRVFLTQPSLSRFAMYRMQLVDWLNHPETRQLTQSLYNAKERQPTKSGSLPLRHACPSSRCSTSLTIGIEADSKSSLLKSRKYGGIQPCSLRASGKRTDRHERRPRTESSIIILECSQGSKVTTPSSQGTNSRRVAFIDLKP